MHRKSPACYFIIFAWFFAWLWCRSVSAQGVVSAASADTSVMVFALSVASAIVLILGGLCWWFIRERMKTSEREKETLHKRLGMGSEQMNELRKAIQDIREVMIRLEGKYLPTSEFRAWCESHNSEHSEMHKRFDRLVEGQGVVMECLKKFEGKLEQNLQSTARLLATKISIRNDGETRHD